MNGSSQNAKGEWSSPAGKLSEKEVAPRVSDSYIRKLRLWIFLALLLLQGVGGYLLWHYAEAGWNQIEVEIRSAVDADDWVIEHPPKPSSDTVGNRQEAEHSSETLEVIPHTPIGSEMPGIEVESIRIDGSVAIVQVVVTETHSSGESITYRESRFFQQSGQGWRRSKPQPEWFGPWQTLETDSFRIHYRQLSAQMIQDAVPRLEAMVKLLRHDFGLPATTGHPKVLIEVSDVKTLPMVALVAAANGTILVPMPALLQIPAEMPPDQAFVQSVIHSLASLLIREVEAQQPYEWPSHTKRGRLMLNALAFWELWAGDEPVVGWRLDSADSSSVDGFNASQASPCSIYNVWDLSITAISSPLSCRTMVWQIQSEILLTPIPSDFLRSLRRKPLLEAFADSLGK